MRCSRHRCILSPWPPVIVQVLVVLVVVVAGCSSTLATSSLPVALISAPLSTPPDSSHIQKELSCDNCKSHGLCGIGHTDPTCFQPGGGMEGHCEEYKANKGQVHVMFAEYLENAFSILDPPLSSDDPNSMPTSPLFPPMPDSDFFLPPVMNLCVTSFSTNSDDHGDLYI